MPNPIDSLPPDVVEAWRSGNKIEAIKRLRQATGAGLAEAKSALDRLERAGASPATPGPPDLVGGISAVIKTLGALRGLPPELMQAWRRGDKAAVIAWLRAQAASGNPQANGLADAIERHPSPLHAKADAGATEHHPFTPRARPTRMPPRPEDMLSPGQVPQAKGGPWMVVVLLLAVAAVWAYFRLT